MTKKFELYKCDKCGNVIEIVLEGEGELVCCSEPMKCMQPNMIEDTKKEAHIPAVETMGTTHVIKVGKIPHPKEKEHYIQFIEVISNDKRYIKRKYLNPDEEPEMILKQVEGENFIAREKCNIHGLFTNGEIK